MARTARINLFFFYVACPHCHEPQPSPIDGSYLMFKDLERPTPNPCTNCKRVYQLPKKWPETWQQEDHHDA